MADDAGHTTNLVDLLRAGNKTARNDLIAHACERMRGLASRMLRDYPVVRRWEQTDDVLQNALIRLNRALSTAPIESSRHFWRLATVQIRRELIDMAKRYLGPQGPGANHQTDGRIRETDDVGQAIENHPDDTNEPHSLEEWTSFHEAVQRLPDEEAEVFDLIYYGELPQKDAATVIGVALRTVKRRWRSARLLLSQMLRGDVSGERRTQE